MRSIPVAMTWELLAHGRWTLPAAFLGGNLLPVLLLSALRVQGEIEPNDPAMIIMHVMFSQMSMFCFAAGAMASMGAPARLFAWPIRNSTLVASRMLPMMLVVGLQTLVSGFALNAMFGLSWPVWGPTLFAATGMAAVQATLWLTEKSPAWLPWAFGVVALALGLWLKSRYGELFSQPNRFWHTVTPAEVLTLLSINAVSFYVGVIGIKWQRRGDALPPWGVLAWIDRLFDTPARPGHRFASAAQAQYWYEWWQKGWAMPAVVIFGLVVGCGGWLLFSRDVKELVEGFYAGGAMLSVVAMVSGMILGNTGSSDSELTMGHFRATRPMTTAEMSRILLTIGFKSVLISWGLWAVSFGVVLLVLMATKTLPENVFAPWQPLGLWCLPLTLLGPWTVSGLVASMSLCGRSQLILKLFCAGFLLVISRPLLATYLVPFALRPQFEEVTNALLGLCFVAGTGWAMIAARRRELLASWAIKLLAGAWIVLSVLAIAAIGKASPTPISGSLLAVGLLGTAAAPLATAPLALASNRVR